MGVAGVSWIGRAVAVVAAVLAMAGCGARVAPQPDAAGVAVATAGGEASAAPASPGAAPTPSESAAVATPPGPASEQPTARPSPNYGPTHNNGTVRIELSATCVRPGSLLVITIAAPPKAGLGMIVGYADNQPHGAMLTGETDANGTYVWRVPVDPTVPEGEATVLVSATGANWSRTGGGTADKKFRVARAGC